MFYDAEEQFIKTGLQLPPAPAPKGVYKPCLISGNYLYLSGHLPVLADGSTIKGRVGSELNEDEGKQAAQQAALTMLASIKGALGSLNKVKRVVKVFGMVNGTPDFVRQPYVINGCSELFAAVWGEDAGVGTRSATGVASLPDNVPVEIEGIFEI
ncbi:MAG: RidA family protein [Tannerella sp.]|jgi:enamine deaminase RidA (YjgF/YER057c/UK114 family)|nr:RidA family protein [Tannerella sp.]